MNNFQRWENYGQVDSPELPETPEIIKKTENFTKMTEYLIKQKETLIVSVSEKYQSKSG